MVEELRWEVTRMVEELRWGGDPNGRGKLPGFTQACGNWWFAASRRLRGAGYTDPTRRTKAVSGPLTARKRGISL